MEAEKAVLKESPDYLSGLFDTLESITDLNYARMYLKEKGFSTSTNWEATRGAISTQLSGRGTKKPVPNAISELELIAKKLMIVGKHYYQVYNLKESQHTKLIDLLKSFEIKPNIYTEHFPLTLPEDILTPTNVPRLSALEHFSDGIALIYSTPRLHTSTETEQKNIEGIRNTVTYKKDIKQHQFDVVFVPFKNHRIELRIPATVGKRDIESAFNKLENHFFSFFNKNFFKLDSHSAIDVHKAIEVIYDMSKYGRVVETKFLSIDNSITMPRHSRKDISVCLREQKYHQAGAKFEAVRCIGVSVRWDNDLKQLKLKNRTEVQLESIAHFDYKKCFRFIIENPVGNKKALSIVSEVLDASV